MGIRGPSALRRHLLQAQRLGATLHFCFMDFHANELLSIQGSQPPQEKQIFCLEAGPTAPQSHRLFEAGQTNV